MRISDWSSDVCSSDLHAADEPVARQPQHPEEEAEDAREDAAGHRHHRGVDQPDDGRAEMRVTRVVLDEGLVDVVAGGFPEEVDPEALAVQVQVLYRVGRREAEIEKYRKRAVEGRRVTGREKLGGRR